MFLERVRVQNFQSFGPSPETISFSRNLTAFLGTNATGKTSAAQAILRLFSVVPEQRQIRVGDFHVPDAENAPPASRQLQIEAVFAFPELKQPGGTAHVTIPEFFRQMSIDENDSFKLRVLLEASWTADGSLNGSIDTTRRIVFTFDDDYGDNFVSLSAADRNRIQALYVPATRSGSREVGAFLRGRVWKAGQWSPKFRTHVEKAATQLSKNFRSEAVVTSVTGSIAARWGELHHLSTDTTPVIEPISRELSALVANAELFFEPSATGRNRAASELSDGQQSLLHIALTAATLDLERDIANGTLRASFDLEPGALPSLTILIVEEPENNLSPFFLSRIVNQLLSLSGSGRAQAVISSHSASVVSRIDPNQVRHFRLRPDRTTVVKRITLPPRKSDEGKFLRQAVRAYPELYFAQFVVLGEGDSEAVVLPMLAAARDIHIDRSFVAVVPLGGRHTNHLWRLLDQLGIPYATLLDLDYGRAGGGEGRIRDACTRLIELGESPLSGMPVSDVADIDGLTTEELREWMDHLEKWNIFFSAPLDLDMLLLHQFASEYKKPLSPRSAMRKVGHPEDMVLGSEENRPNAPELLTTTWRDNLFWYRYLFLTNSKPNTHLQVLARVPKAQLAKPGLRLTRLIDVIAKAVGAP